VDPYSLPVILWAEDVASLLGVSVVHARRLMSRGGIPAKKVGKRWLVLRDVLLKSLAPAKGDSAGVA
jgi:excisionase family DNA binding protein